MRNFQSGTRRGLFLFSAETECAPSREERNDCGIRDLAGMSISARQRRAVVWFSPREGADSRWPEGGADHTPGAQKGIRRPRWTKLRQWAGRALRKPEIEYRLLLFERNPIPMWVFDRSNLRFLAVNKAAIRKYGYSEGEFLGMTIADIRPEEDIPEVLRHVAKHESGLQEPENWKHRRKDGTIIEVEIVGHDLEVYGADAMLVAAHDVTERNRAQQIARQAEENYRGIFDNAIVGIFQATLDGRPLCVNHAMAEIHGYASPEELLAEVSNASAQLIADPVRMMDLHHQALQRSVRGAEVEILRKDRSRGWIALNLRAVRDGDGNLTHLEGTAEDITERKAAEAQARYLAYYDVLTGLLNRTLMKDRLENALAGARGRNEKVAVLFLDLDRFKVINDSLGQAAGDQILKEVARRLRNCVRAQDSVARAGGDKYLVLLDGVTTVAEAAASAARIADEIAAKIVVMGHSLNTTSSIGISIFPDDSDDPETLIKYAEQAMYCVKELGRDSFRFFTEDLNRGAMERLRLESDLRLALERREFFLVYQPQVRLDGRNIVGIEALIRWRHPRLGLVPPGNFISIAENCGLILPVGEWVLKTACRQMRLWQSNGLKAVPVAVNVSAMQFRSSGFCGLIRDTLAATGLDPEFLELEVTESLLLANADIVLPVLRELKQIGVKLSIDDFGTGYSSLSYLKQFPFDKLKIDGCFIRDIASGNSDAAITAAIISMAKSLKLAVIAEGVETEEQMLFLHDHGCEEFQGFLFSEPVVAGIIASMLSRGPSNAGQEPASDRTGLLASPGMGH